MKKNIVLISIIATTCLAPTFPNYTEDTTPTADDLILTCDVSGGNCTTKKVSFTNLFSSLSALVSITCDDTGVVYADGDDTPTCDVAGMYYDKTTDTLHVGSVITAATSVPQTDYYPALTSDTHWITGVNGDGGNDNDDNFVLSEGTTLGSSNRISTAPGGITIFTQTIVTAPSSETIAGGATITANACGGIKQIISTGAQTTSTTDTFTTPSAANTGCCMDVINVDSADAITLDENANFVSAGDVVLGIGDTVRVCSNGTTWYQIGATGNN